MSDYHMNNWSPELDRQDELKRQAYMHNEINQAVVDTVIFGAGTVRVTGRIVQREFPVGPHDRSWCG